MQSLPAGREVATSPNQHSCISILATECGQSSFVVNMLCNTLEELSPNNVFPDMSSKCWGLVTRHGIYYERVMAKSLAEMGTGILTFQWHQPAEKGALKMQWHKKRKNTTGKIQQSVMCCLYKLCHFKYDWHPPAQHLLTFKVAVVSSCSLKNWLSDLFLCKKGNNSV